MTQRLDWVFQLEGGEFKKVGDPEFGKIPGGLLSLMLIYRTGLITKGPKRTEGSGVSGGFKVGQPPYTPVCRGVVVKIIALPSRNHCLPRAQ